MADLSENIRKVKSTLLPGVKLLVVSKYRPVEQLMECYRVGERSFAESRPLEFESKVRALPADIEWHFIGHLQTNKLKHVLPYRPLIHSVDSAHLLDAIEDFSRRGAFRTDVLLEVHVGAEATKHGFMPDRVEEEMQRAASLPHVKIRGLMCMASNTSDMGRVDSEFALMEELFHRLRGAFPHMVDFDQLSMGMSNDYEIAQRHEATMVRLGSAIFE